jgi:hypothetical protein
MIMKKIMVLAVFSFLLVVACKGPQGEVGPQGTQGVQGIQGVQGKDANKIRYSNWVSYKNWSGVSASLDRRASNINIEGLFVEDGVFLFYVFQNETAKIIPSQYSNSVSLDYGLSKQLNNNVVIELIAKTTFSGALSHPLVEGLKFRWVFIPLVASMRSKAIDYSDYEAVKKAYNIPD